MERRRMPIVISEETSETNYIQKSAPESFNEETRVQETEMRPPGAVATGKIHFLYTDLC